MSCCMCEPVETADTHAVGARQKQASEHGPHWFGPVCRGAASLAHRQVLETRARAEVNVRSCFEKKQQAQD